MTSEVLNQAVSENKPMLIGHRGAPGYRPEHTAASYRLAFAQGVDAVEPDIVVTRDGVLVIRHENEISGTTNVAELPEFADRFTQKTVDGEALSGWFTEDFTWAELQTLRSRERLPKLRPENTRFDDAEPLLSFADLLELIAAEANPSLKIVVELKHVHYFKQLGHNIVQLTLQELAKHAAFSDPERIIFECFELGALQELKTLGVESELIFLMETLGAPADEVAIVGAGVGKRGRTYEWYRSDAGLDYLATQVAGISLDKADLFAVADGEVVASDIVARAHARGLKVFTWTMRPENKFLQEAFQTMGNAGGSSLADWGAWQDEWRLILSTGLDGVFLDHPDLLAKL